MNNSYHEHQIRVLEQRCADLEHESKFILEALAQALQSMYGLSNEVMELKKRVIKDE